MTIKLSSNVAAAAVLEVMSSVSALVQCVMGPMTEVTGLMRSLTSVTTSPATMSMDVIWIMEDVIRSVSVTSSQNINILHFRSALIPEKVLSVAA